MGVIIFVFCCSLIVALCIMWMLITVIKIYSNTARIIEITGYALLMISIIWTGTVNLTSEASADSDLLRLEEKLNVLWSFEKDQKDYIYDGDFNDITDDYNRLNEHWHGPVFDNDLVKQQDKFAKKISYGLFVLSTLFISAGRLSELFISKPNENIPKRKSGYKARSRIRRRKRLK